MLLPVLHANNWLDNDFDDFFDGYMMPKMNSTAPAINVKETPQEYDVELAAPGMTKGDFNVNINEEGCLCIKMEHKDEKKEGEKKSHYLRREFSYSSFEQKLTLPDDVEKDKVQAKVENGVLNIMLPRKAAEQKVQKKIEVA